MEDWIKVLPLITSQILLVQPLTTQKPQKFLIREGRGQICQLINRKISPLLSFFRARTICLVTHTTLTKLNTFFAKPVGSILSTLLAPPLMHVAFHRIV